MEVRPSSSVLVDMLMLVLFLVDAVAVAALPPLLSCRLARLAGVGLSRRCLRRRCGCARRCNLCGPRAGAGDCPHVSDPTVRRCCREGVPLLLRA